MPDQPRSTDGTWAPGQVIVRREVLALDPIARAGPVRPWHGRAWAAAPVVVVEDSDDLLATYFAPGAHFAFPTDQWPITGGVHPWDSGDRRWGGHGCLMLQRPGDHHAVWHFWDGPDRTFTCWYVNLQTAFVRTAVGYDTQDLELDLIVAPDGTVEVKDDELLALRVEEGRLTAPLVDWIRDLGTDLRDRIEAGDWWWSREWASWQPDPAWQDSRLPEGWEHQV